MKVVVAIVAALTLAAYSFASAGDYPTQTMGNPNVWTNTNTPTNTNTLNNTNAPNHNGGAWNNTNTTNNTGTTNNTNTPTNGNTWNNNTNMWNNGNGTTQGLMKVSHEGYAAMRAVRAARVAIFNGQPNVAIQMLNTAKTNLAAAAKNAPMFVANTETTVNGKMVADEMTVGKVNWVPIDGQFSLADTFVVSPQKAAHIQKANGHFQNGQSKQAIEELRLASIDVTCTRVLMPLTATTNCVAEATKLVGQQKYYEANVALKAAEDGLVMNSANWFEMPTVNVSTQKDKETN